MNDQDLRDFLEHMAAEEPAPFVDVEPLARRARRRAARNVALGAVTVAAVIALVFAGVSQLPEASPKIPANPPDESSGPGIFAPLAGRIVSYGDSSLWGVDVTAPAASTLVRVSLAGTADPDQLASLTLPLGWASDGTELLFVRQDPNDDSFVYDRYLYLLRADGSQTRVVPEPVSAAAISLDGSRVVYTTDASKGVYIVDPDGGKPVRIVAAGEEPILSPDGTQIAYLTAPRRGCCVESRREHVWVANADGTGAHEILADEPALDKGVFELTWSPAGDRIAMENSLNHHVAIYTFAPDGSAFTRVIEGGFNPQWSPDGSQIAYGFPGSGGVAVADADGSNVQVFNFGDVGPWHPGVPQSGLGGAEASAPPSEGSAAAAASAPPGCLPPVEAIVRQHRPPLSTVPEPLASPRGCVRGPALPRL